MQQIFTDGTARSHNRKMVCLMLNTLSQVTVSYALFILPQNQTY